MQREEETQELQQFQMPPMPKLEFIMEPPIQISCQNLIIAFYGPSSLFIQSTMPDLKLQSHVNFQKTKQKSLASIYKQKGGKNAYFIFNQDLQVMKEIHFSDFILKHFKFAQCFIFLSLSKNTLNKQNTSSIQYISTQYWKQRCHGSKFEEGLIGPHAELIGWGEANQIPIVCYIGIFGEYQLNRTIIESTFGALKGKYGLNSDRDISASIRKFNMSKYSHKLYL